ncbi:MAG: DegT/DnrJ/EryC1/StrS family aminotransferase [Actinobacteria bacterium]|nr:DegT/DnrJ/EryC1/StrS family aminotransferase [Actinomycetota bacterium]
MIPFLDLRREARELEAELGAAFARVNECGRYVLGPEVEAFEREFAAFCGQAHCVGVGNGLDALQLVFRAHELGPGDEVIVPAYTAVATWMAVTLVGATPVGVDVCFDTYNLDPELVGAAITSKTRAIVPVHLFGQPADIPALVEIASEHGLVLIEDAAQAHGAQYGGRLVGALAHASTYSFYPTKNLAALGDGGAVTTDDADLADRVRLLRAYGWRERGESETMGLNSRLDELQAAFLRVKLRRLEAWNRRRRELAAHYCAGLSAAPGVNLPHVPEWANPVWHLFVVGHDRRDELAVRLAEMGIGTLVHYEPLPHLTRAYRATGWEEGALPVAERLATCALSLPLSPQLSDEEADVVVAAVLEAAGALE